MHSFIETKYEKIIRDTKFEGKVYHIVSQYIMDWFQQEVVTLLEKNFDDQDLINESTSYDIFQDIRKMYCNN